MTPKQLALLRAMAAFETEHGYPPSFEEMRVATGLASKSGIHRLILALEKQGLVRRSVPNNVGYHRNLTLTATGRTAAAGGRGPLASFSTVKLVDELRRRGCGPSIFDDVPAMVRS